MNGDILALVINSLIDLTGNPFFIGIIFMLILALILSATNLPIQAVIVVELGFIAALVAEGWLEGWIGALVYVIVGAIFFWVIYQLFKA